MDYSLLALIGLLVAIAVISTRQHRPSWRGQPGSPYQRVITIGAFGLWLTIAGALGADLRHMHGFFQGTKWTDAPIWWEFGAGLALLALAFVLARRIPPPART
jgi:hypothetical protein